MCITDGRNDFKQFQLSFPVDRCNDAVSRFRVSINAGEIAKWLFSLGVNINAVEDDAFRSSCANGHIEIAKWLWNISDKKINIYSSDDYVFKNSPEEIIKWLTKL